MKFAKGFIIASLAIGVSSTAFAQQREQATDAYVYGPGCPWGSIEPVVVTGTPLHAGIKWCGISEAPSVNDPTLVCQAPGDFKTMLWRRHERASDCIWIPQCAITLRSGGTISLADYHAFNDLSPTPGALGDIQVTPSTTELFNSWVAADAHWSAQPKGIIALSARNLVDAAGTPVARGIAVQGDITRPWMAVADPNILCQLNERSLAHEFGHVLSLPHVTTAGNLMQTGGTGATLTAAQCSTARAYLSSNPILDPKAGHHGSSGFPFMAAAAREDVDRMDFLYDSKLRDVEIDYMDIMKVLAVDNSISQGDLTLVLALETLMPSIQKDQPLVFWVALDIDNNEETGGNPSDLIENFEMKGVEYVAQIRVIDGGKAEGVLFEQGDLSGYVPVLIDQACIQAARDDIDLLICEPFPEYKGPDVIPSFTNVRFSLCNEALKQLGFPDKGPLFPNGLRVQAVSSAKHLQGVIDQAPDRPETMPLLPVYFPTIQVPERFTRRETVPVHVEGMWPNAALMVYLGEYKLGVDAKTDGEGNADFTFEIPSEIRFGLTLLTVGVRATDETLKDNAVTADAIVEIVEVATAVDDPSSVRASAALSAIRPMPTVAGEGVEIEFILGAKGRVAITVFDILGKTVTTLAPVERDKGIWGVTWNGHSDDGTPVTHGTYFVQLTVDGIPADTRSLTIVD